MSTIQLDFMLPERFELEYQAADGSRQRPVMIHRALFGSIERFFGVLTEHYAGAFPAWLSPVQAVGIPVTDAHVPYLSAFAERLRAEDVRIDVDTSDDRMQKKIRTWTKQKVPFLLIAGDDDAGAGTMSFRYRDGSQRNGIPLDQAAEEILATIRARANAGPSAALFDEAEAAEPGAGAGTAVEHAAAGDAVAERAAVERVAAGEGASGEGTAPA
jgi:threonyl-tRNA synthetase